MFNITATYILVCAVAIFSNGCNKNYIPSDKKVIYHYITDTVSKDKTTEAHIVPYRDSLDKSMNTIIGIAGIDMPKGKPESLLGNFFCDALRNRATVYFNQPIDVCIMNYGGLRITSISKGSITIGKIYELMPFDNFLVLMKVPGKKLLPLLNHIAKEGGWPLSGVVMKIKDDAAIEVTINNEPFDTEKIYSLLISDYMADGGDKLDMLKGLSYDNSGVFVRDALTEYIIETEKTGKLIESKIEGRILYAE
jgi:2',3'-cyclic-nucleotide 2'-phosphodiesterase (5'-nucleotidase family)